jgi:CysZ protein
MAGGYLLLTTYPPSIRVTFSMIREIRLSIAAYAEGMALVSSHKLWRYALPGAILSTVVGVAVVWLSLRYARAIGEAVEGLFGAMSLPFLDTAVSVLFVLAALLTYVVLFKYIALVVSAPFMSLLSEKIEEKLYGRRAAPFSLAEAVRGMSRGLKLAVRNAALEIVFTLVLALLGLTGILAPITIALTFAVQAYYAGFGNLDYTLERYLGVRESAEFVRRHRGMAMGNGGAYVLLLFVPIVGWFLAPVYATAAATLTVLRTLKAET